MLVWSALYALPIAVACLPNLDPDIWWHLRTGQWIVTEGRVPTTDPFSQYGLASGKPWVSYSWLFGVLVYGLYRAWGFAGIFLGRALLTAAIVFALHRLVARREPRFVVAAVLTGASVLAMLPVLTDRPWLFSILFCFVTLHVILNLREGGSAWQLVLLPPLYVLWANLHIQFVYGLFLLGLACIAPVGDRLRQYEPATEGAARFGSRRWWALVAVTAACLAATLVTPYHVHLYEVVRGYATQRVGLQQIAECQAPDFREVWDWCTLALTLGGAFALGQRRRVSCFEVLLLAASAWFAFRTRRDVWFLVLGATTAVVTATPRHLVVPVFWPTRRQGLAVAGLVLPLLLAYWCFATGGNHIQTNLEAHYPVRAAAVVREHGCPSPLYNHFNWGGFLMWDLPELPVAMDGRANLHGEVRVERSMLTWLGRPGWDTDPELEAAGVIIAETHAPLTSLLRRDHRFRVLYEDDVAVVFVADENPTTGG